MPKPRLQPLTHWPKPTALLQIYPTTPSQPRRPPSHLRPRRPINLHCRGHLLLYPTLLPHCTNTLLPLPQQAHPTQQCPPLPTTTNTFTLYHRPTITHTHQHPRHRNIHLLRRQQEWVSQPVAPRHPLHPTKHRSPPPDFRSTWHRHKPTQFKQSPTQHTLSIDSTPFWWLLLHLDMLVLAPSTATERSHKSIHATIQDRINSIYSGNIEYVYNMAMSCR